MKFAALTYLAIGCAFYLGMSAYNIKSFAKADIPSMIRGWLFAVFAWPAAMLYVFYPRSRLFIHKLSHGMIDVRPDLAIFFDFIQLRSDERRWGKIKLSGMTIYCCGFFTVSVAHGR